MKEKHLIEKTFQVVDQLLGFCPCRADLIIQIGHFPLNYIQLDMLKRLEVKLEDGSDIGRIHFLKKLLGRSGAFIWRIRISS